MTDSQQPKGLKHWAVLESFVAGLFPMGRLSINSGVGWKGASSMTEALKAFFAPRSSADRDIVHDKDILVRRSRQLFQNNSFSGALINSFNTNVVGTGIKPRPNLSRLEILGITQEQAEEWCRRTFDLFTLWAGSKKCDAEKKNNFYELQDLALKTQLIGGDCFALMKYRADNQPFGLSVKLMESDRCMNPFGVFETDKVCEGVEVDDDGAAVAYHFTKKPAWGIDNYTDFVDCVRVPAFDAFGCPNVIHLFTADRTDQRRGVPLLAPIILQMKQQERYQDAELMAAVVSAMFTAFITSNSTEQADSFLGNVLEDERVEKTHGETGLAAKAAVEMSPGGIVELEAGEDVKFANPNRPNANYSPFVEGIFAEAASRCGISFELVLKKFNSSYNAVRAAILESKKTFDRVKMNFISDFCQPIYEKWLTHAVLLGIVEAPGFFEDPIKRALWSGCRWISDAAFLLDPLKETQAIKQQLDEQLIDRDTACAMVNGGDYERTANSLAKEKRLRAEIGLQEPGTINKTESFSVATDDVNQSDL